jgi:hypothetical protein
MKSNEFVAIFKRQLEEDLPKFEKNLAEEDRDYCDWVNLFFNWMEWGTESDCEYFYKNFLDDKKEKENANQ